MYITAILKSEYHTNFKNLPGEEQNELHTVHFQVFTTGICLPEM